MKKKFTTMLEERVIKYLKIKSIEENQSAGDIIEKYVNNEIKSKQSSEGHSN